MDAATGRSTADGTAVGSSPAAAVAAAADADATVVGVGVEWSIR